MPKFLSWALCPRGDYWASTTFATWFQYESAPDCRCPPKYDCGNSKLEWNAVLPAFFFGRSIKLAEFTGNKVLFPNFQHHELSLPF